MMARLGSRNLAFGYKRSYEEKLISIQNICIKSIVDMDQLYI
jgi:hypothetical protein